MTTSELKRGDRVDYPARDLKNGEVIRVGHATAWLLFPLANGTSLPLTADPRDLRPHTNPCRVEVGEFVLRDASGGMIWIQSQRTGESMHTDIAKLESCLARFWRQEF